MSNDEIINLDAIETSNEPETIELDESETIELNESPEVIELSDVLDMAYQVASRGEVIELEETVAPENNALDWDRSPIIRDVISDDLASFYVGGSQDAELIEFDDEDVGPSPESEDPVPPEEMVEELYTKYYSEIVNMRGKFTRSIADRSVSNSFGKHFGDNVTAMLSRIDLGTSRTMVTREAMEVVYAHNTAKDNRAQVDPVKLLIDRCKADHRSIVPMLPDVYDKVNKAYLQTVREVELESARNNAEGRIITSYYLNEVVPSLELLSEVNSSEDKKVCNPTSVSKRDSVFDIECGHCNKISTKNTPLFIVLIQAVRKTSNDLLKSKKVFPQPFKCECGYVNMLPTYIHDNLEVFISNSMGIPEAIVNPAGSVSPSATYVLYLPSEDSIEAELRKFYKRVISLDTNYTVNEEDMQDLYYKMEEWYRSTNEYVGKLSTARSNIKTTLNRNHSDVNREGLSEYLELVARSLCEMFNEDFDTLRDNALASLYHFLRDNHTLLAYISPSYLYEIESKLMLEDYFKLPITEFNSEEEMLNVYRRCCLQLEVRWNDEWTVSDAAYIAAQCYASLDVLESSLTELREIRQSFLQNLVENERLYGFIEIKNLSVESEKLNGAFVEDSVKSWASNVTLLMMINHISDRFYDYWSTFSYRTEDGKSLNNFKFKNAKTKTRGKVDEIMKFILGNHSSRLRTRYNPYTLSNLFLSLSELYEYHAHNLKSDELGNLKFGFMNVDLLSMVSAAGKYETAPVSYAFSGFNECIKELLDLTRKEPFKLLDLDSKLDYYIYHYGHMFSREEIESSLTEIPAKIKSIITLDRNVGESFVNYIKRVRSQEHKGSTVNKSPAWRDYAKFVKYLPVVVGMSALMDYLRIELHKESKLIPRDLLYFSYVFGGQDSFSFLEIPPPTQDLKNSLTPLEFNLTEREVRKNTILNSFVYPSVELRIIREGTDESFVDIESYILEDKDKFLSEIITPKMRDFVDEYYSG